MIEKIYTYEDLPKKGTMPNIHYTMSDTTILEHLNKIARDANLLTEIKSVQTEPSEGLSEISITFKMLVKKDDKS